MHRSFSPCDGTRTRSTGPADRPVVTPFARALDILSAFTAEDRWLCNGDLAARARLPASTVTRLTRTLLALGYLRYDASKRKFRLGSSALALGYRAAAQIELREIGDMAHQRMRSFADRHHVHVHLCARNRLDLVVIDSCCTSTIPESLQPSIGTRLALASSAAGWALLASLPDEERDYLLQSAERQPAGEWSETWRHLRHRSYEAIGQVRQGGFCVALGKSGQPMTMVAAPIKLPGEAPLAVSCMAPSMLVGRERSVHELGPALVRMAQDIQRSRVSS